MSDLHFTPLQVRHLENKGLGLLGVKLCCTGYTASFLTFDSECIPEIVGKIPLDTYKQLLHTLNSCASTEEEFVKKYVREISKYCNR